MFPVYILTTPTLKETFEPIVYDIGNAFLGRYSLSQLTRGKLFSIIDCMNAHILFSYFFFFLNYLTFFELKPSIKSYICETKQKMTCLLQEILVTVR